MTSSVRIAGLALVLGAALVLALEIDGLGGSTTQASAVAPRELPTKTTGAPGASSAGDELVEGAVARGLLYLRRTQDPATGGWIQDIGYKRGSDYVLTASRKPHVGVTALALMAFLAGGHLPNRGEHGRVVELGVNYVVSCVSQESGFISQHDTRMYSHAFATLFLAEIYGMTHRDDVKEKLQLAVDLIVKSQNQLGSWRYQPFSDAADMSITVCQIMALRAARNVGLRVPKTTIDRAYDYVDRSAYKNRGHRNYGGFRYKLDERGSRTTFALTAAGIATLNHAGIYDHELVTAGISFLRNEITEFNREYRGHYFYWYGHYYASQVFFLTSESGDGDELWRWYYDLVSRDLLAFQEADGSWPNETGPGRAFATAIACILLQIPKQYLPIFHR